MTVSVVTTPALVVSCMSSTTEGSGPPVGRTLADPVSSTELVVRGERCCEDRGATEYPIDSTKTPSGVNRLTSPVTRTSEGLTTINSARHPPPKVHCAKFVPLSTVALIGTTGSADIRNSPRELVTPSIAVADTSPPTARNVKVPSIALPPLKGLWLRNAET